MKIIGNNAARYNFGINGFVSWRGIDFSFLMQGVAKRDAWIGGEIMFPHAGTFSTFLSHQMDYWTPENPTNASAQPSNMGTYRSKAGSWGNAKSEMSHTMFSSNFLKISYITLGYTFKPSVLEKMKLGNLRLYATVQNPFIFCAKDVVDPEQLNVSINTSDAMTRNVIFGINLSFK